MWPEPTHARKPTKSQQKWRTAADCIDWSVPSKSIFGRKKDLAPATLRRVAKGMKKFVIDSPSPFIVPIANWSGELAQSANEPLRTVTAWPRGGSFAMASPVMVGAGGPSYAGKPVSAEQPIGTLMTQSHRAMAAAHLVKFRFDDAGKALDEPMPTITSGGNYQRPAGAAHAMGVCTAVMAQMNGGFNTTDAKPMDEPMTTVTNTGSQQQLVTANLVHLRGNCNARDAIDPLHTISAGGTHHGLVTAFMERHFGASVGQAIDEPAPTITAGRGGKSSLVELKLSPEHEEGALRVAAFLISYYGTENVSGYNSPAPTITTKDRLALVTVMVKGTPYVIVDICLRMLQPHELYRAQGFLDDYIIDKGADGRKFTKTEQVHMCGNSVSPPPMTALARANDPWRAAAREAVAA